jgi:hypothetical protein
MLPSKIGEADPYDHALEALARLEGDGVRSRIPTGATGPAVAKVQDVT